MSESLIIRLTDGEERETIRFDDSSWQCPFCSSPNFPHPGEERMWPYPCDNPACLAGGNGELSRVLEVKKRWADEAEAKAARQRLEASLQADRDRRQQEADEARAAFTQEAAAQGLCVSCWNHSTDYGRFPRHAVRVKHRNRENCPQARKDAARAARYQERAR